LIFENNFLSFFLSQDRSNGYEKQFLRREAGKEAESENAYKWSTEDM